MEELFRFLSQKSISATGEGMTETVDMLQVFMEDAGIETRLLSTDGWPALYGEIGDPADGPTALIYGHYDVQPAVKEEGWAEDPFSPYIAGDKIVCRGASDDKGQLFTHIKAVEAWRQACGSLPVHLKFLFEGEEEIGSPHLHQLVGENRHLLDCDLVIISDSHIHESGRPVIILGLKGMLYVQLSVEGGSKDLHSKFAAVVESPVWRLIEALSSLRDEAGQILIDGFYDSAIPPSPAEKEAAEQIPLNEEQILKNLGVNRLRSSKTYGSQYFHNMMFEPTCNIDGIQAGYTGEGAKTALPANAMAKLDFRLVPGQEPERVLELLKQHLIKKGFTDIQVSVEGMMRPCRTNLKEPYVEEIGQAIERAWGQAPLLYPSIGGSGPNYIFTQHLGVPCITVPYAAADQNNHGVNETMIVKGFYNGILTNGEIIRGLGQIEDRGRDRRRR